MSLFDSIRYPISQEPTKEEIGNLPQAIWDKWRDDIRQTETSTLEERFTLLRKIILEYDDNLPCDQVSP